MTTIFDVAALAGGTRRSLSASGDNRAVSLQREYAFGADELWSAWTDPERLARWLGEVRGEPAPASTVELVMGPSDVATVTILWCEQPTRLIVKWEWPNESDSFVDLRIEPIDDSRCRLHLEHVALSDATGSDYGAGWDEFLLRAELFLGATDPAGSPWPQMQSVVGQAWRDLAADHVSDPRWASITGADDGQVLRASRTVPHPIAPVWASLTDADSLSSWFGEITGELSVGGEFVVTFDGGAATGSVLSCTPMTTFEISWTWDHDGIDTGVRVTLEPAHDGTTIRLEQSGVIGPAVGYAAGWAAYLAAVERSMGGAPRSDDLWQAEWTLATSMTAADEPTR